MGLELNKDNVTPVSLLGCDLVGLYNTLYGRQLHLKLKSALRNLPEFAASRMSWSGPKQGKFRIFDEQRLLPK
jgi:hypothetical protein